MVDCFNPKSTRIRSTVPHPWTKPGQAPTKQKSRLKITHAQNDARYVEMGKLLHLTKDPSSDRELEGMNVNKNGRPYSYPDTVIMSIAGIRAIHGPLPYRMCQGMAESALGEEDAPDHVTLWRRIKAMRYGRKVA